MVKIFSFSRQSPLHHCLVICGLTIALFNIILNVRSPFIIYADYYTCFNRPYLWLCQREKGRESEGNERNLDICILDSLNFEELECEMLNIIKLIMHKVRPNHEVMLMFL